MPFDVQAYVATLAEPQHSRVAEIYADARALAPAAVEGTSYGMPALLYRDKGLIAVMSTKNHIAIYPFGNLAELATAATEAGLETTKGSIHLRGDQMLPRELLEQLIVRRMRRIDSFAAGVDKRRAKTSRSNRR